MRPSSRLGSDDVVAVGVDSHALPQVLGDPGVGVRPSVSLLREVPRVLALQSWAVGGEVVAGPGHPPSALVLLEADDHGIKALVEADLVPAPPDTGGEGFLADRVGEPLP